MLAACLPTPPARAAAPPPSPPQEAEEHKQSLREEIERKYFPERYEFWPFGDPFIEKRKAEARRTKQAGRKQWYDED